MKKQILLISSIFIFGANNVKALHIPDEQEQRQEELRRIESRYDALTEELAKLDKTIAEKKERWELSNNETKQKGTELSDCENSWGGRIFGCEKQQQAYVNMLTETNRLYSDYIAHSELQISFFSALIEDTHKIKEPKIEIAQNTPSKKTK